MKMQSTPLAAGERGGPGAYTIDTRNEIEPFRLEFSGSGGEYFRVWIVNLLLSIVTLGLYTPLARRRTARYFYDHTLVAGSPLEFTAPLRKMVFGFVLFALLYVAYKHRRRDRAGHRGLMLPDRAAVLAPYIWGSAMRFRLASTRWRGLQLQFAARWKEVYVASWPIFADGAGLGGRHLRARRPVAEVERRPRRAPAGRLGAALAWCTRAGCGG